MGIQPVFIFSVSRSGSTLVQRIVAAHEGVATAPEPWILLPHAYTLRRQGVDAEYFQQLLATAVEDFCAAPGGRSRLPGGDARVRAAPLRARRRGRGDPLRRQEPPYCLVAEEIMRIFPEGKFVFLWRNPLSVIASMIETWGPWRPTFMTADLFVGLPPPARRLRGARLALARDPVRGRGRGRRGPGRR